MDDVKKAIRAEMLKILNDNEDPVKFIRPLKQLLDVLERLTGHSALSPEELNDENAMHVGGTSYVRPTMAGGLNIGGGDAIRAVREPLTEMIEMFKPTADSQASKMVIDSRCRVYETLLSSGGISDKEKTKIVSDLKELSVRLEKQEEMLLIKTGLASPQLVDGQSQEVYNVRTQRSAEDAGDAEPTSAGIHPNDVRGRKHQEDGRREGDDGGDDQAVSG